MRGFETERDLELEAFHHRPAGSADGKLRGSMRNGQYAYTSHYSLAWVLARSVRLSVQRCPAADLGSGLSVGLPALCRSAHRASRRRRAQTVRAARSSAERIRDALGIAAAGRRDALTSALSSSPTTAGHWLEAAISGVSSSMQAAPSTSTSWSSTMGATAARGYVEERFPQVRPFVARIVASATPTIGPSRSSTRAMSSSSTPIPRYLTVASPSWSQIMDRQPTESPSPACARCDGRLPRLLDQALPVADQRDRGNPRDRAACRSRAGHSASESGRGASTHDETPCDWVSGSFMLTRREALEAPAGSTSASSSSPRRWTSAGVSGAMAGRSCTCRR